MEDQRGQDDIEHVEETMREAEREIEELGITAHEFEVFEKDFQFVLQELAGDKSLERFRLEYEKLHKALKASHDNEKRHIKRCKELNTEINSHAVKVQIALKLAKEDAQEITHIKSEVDKTWKLVDYARDKEEQLKSQLTLMKAEVVELTRRIELDDVVPVAQQQLVDSLVKEKEEVLGDKEDKFNKLKAFKERNIELSQRAAQLEENKMVLENDIRGLKDQIVTTKQQTEKEEGRKKEYETKIEETKAALDKTQLEVVGKKKEIGDMKTRIKNLQETTKQRQGELEAEQTRKKNTELYNFKLEEKLRFQEEMNHSLIVDADLKELAIKKKEEEVAFLEADRAKKSKEIAVMQRKNRTSEAERLSAEAQKEETRLQMTELQRVNESLHRSNEYDRKEIENTMRDIQLLTKECVGTEGHRRREEQLLFMKGNEHKKIENEITGSRTEAAKISTLIGQLERDKEKYAIEASSALAKYTQGLEEVKLKNSIIGEVQKKNLEAEAKLKQQQNLYEAVRSDRNLYSKNLLESNEEITDLRQKYKILQHQIENLHDEINLKNNAIREELIEKKKIEEKNRAFETTKKNQENRVEVHEKTIKSYENDIAKLKHLISESEQERVKQKKEYEMVINDRDILGTQLIKRNEELAALYEKIKIQQSTLAKGEVQYQERVIDSTLLKNKIGELRKELVLSKKQVSCVPSLKREVHALQRELMEMRTKVKALREELKNPMNVHRYRKLGGTNPETYESIQKIQSLQRRLIAKTEEVEEKEFLIQEKEKLYVELKNILARQPGSEVAEQLEVYQDNLKEKAKQMKTMVLELNNYQAQVNHYKFEIERLNKELNGLKDKWFSAQEASS
jgi:chromosome segregation ATPase